MNILLVYPEFPDSFWSFKHALPFIIRRAAHPPLGLLTVASMLPRAWTARLVDVNVRGLTAEDLAQGGGSHWLEKVEILNDPGAEERSS